MMCKGNSVQYVKLIIYMQQLDSPYGAVMTGHSNYSTQ
jgi:hypothetical protein